LVKTSLSKWKLAFIPPPKSSLPRIPQLDVAKEPSMYEVPVPVVIVFDALVIAAEVVACKPVK
jgi:hypothetical protein